MVGIDRFIARLRRSRYADVRRADPPGIEEVTIVSATITIPANLERQMLGKARASGQQLEEFALDAFRKAVEAPSPAQSMNGVEDDTWLDVEHAVLNGQIARVEKDDSRGIKYVIEGTGMDQMTSVGVVGRFTGADRYLIITVYKVTEPDR